MTSVNPFAQFIIKEINERPAFSLSDQDQKYWELDEQIFRKPQGEKVKPENLFKTSYEMFAIYKFTNDPAMRIKSAKYTGNEFKQVMEIIKVEDSLLESSQMINSILLIKQQQQLQQQMQNQFQMMQQFQMNQTQSFNSPASQPEVFEERKPNEAKDDEKELAQLNSQLHDMLGK